MVGTRVGAVVAMLALTVATAEAQYTGVVTGQLGAVAGGDIRDSAVAPGASMAVLDENGLGVELDVSHNGDFDSSFADSSITPVMLNVTWVYPHRTIRPFVTAGAGVMRVRAAFIEGSSPAGGTDFAWNAGGGVLYMLNEAFGVRGDVRYFRHFERQDNIPLGSNGLLDLIRTSIGIAYTWPME